MKEKIKSIVFFTSLVVIFVIFKDQILTVTEVLVNVLAMLIQENAIPIVVLGFPILYYAYRSERKKKEKLQQRLDAHIARWEDLSKNEESGSSLINNPR